jgi:hypothetical protein
VIPQPHTLKCRTVPGTEPKLACIQQAFVFNVFWTVLRIAFSNRLPLVEKRLIGRKFWGNFGSFPLFGNIMKCASFRGFGKCDSRRRWLNKCVRCDSCLLGRWPRHSFGIPSNSQAFLNYNLFPNLCMPQGLTFPKGVLSLIRVELGLGLHLSFIAFLTEVTRCK